MLYSISSPIRCSAVLYGASDLEFEWQTVAHFSLGMLFFLLLFVQLAALNSDVASLVQVLDSAALLLHQHMAFFLHMPQVCLRIDAVCGSARVLYSSTVLCCSAE